MRRTKTRRLAQKRGRTDSIRRNPFFDSKKELTARRKRRRQGVGSKRRRSARKVARNSSR